MSPTEENEEREEKTSETNFQYSSSVQYVPRQEFEQWVNTVKELQKVTLTYGKMQNTLSFPNELLEKLPNVIRKTIKGVMLNYEHDFPDFCFWGMRKALIDSIRIRFEMDKKEKLLYDTQGNPYGLPKWIDLTKQKRYISSKIAADLKCVKAFGDSASHDYMTSLQKEEVLPVFVNLRLALSRLFYKEK